MSGGCGRIWLANRIEASATTIAVKHSPASSIICWNAAALEALALAAIVDTENRQHRFPTVFGRRVCVVNGRFEQLDLPEQSQSLGVTNDCVRAVDERLVGIGLGSVKGALLG